VCGLFCCRFIRGVLRWSSIFGLDFLVRAPAAGLIQWPIASVKELVFPCLDAAVRLRILSWSALVFADFFSGRAASGLHLTLSRSVSRVRPVSNSCSCPSTQTIVSVSDFIRACLCSAEERP
jgi:hypothetical protein